jgi:hypothetical protein
MDRLDKLGFDMTLSADDRVETVRIGFASEKTTQDAIHEAMVRLARLARQKLEA